MHSNLRGRALAAIALLSLSGAPPAGAQSSYLHNGRHAMQDFRDVNAYEQSHPATPQLLAGAAQTAQYDNGMPDFSGVRAYERSHPATRQLLADAAAQRGQYHNGMPDFRGVNAYIAANAGASGDQLADAGKQSPARSAKPSFADVGVPEAGTIPPARHPIG